MLFEGLSITPQASALTTRLSVPCFFFHRDTDSVTQRNKDGCLVAMSFKSVTLQR